jgi:hypothetical protein
MARRIYRIFPQLKSPLPSKPEASLVSREAAHDGWSARSGVSRSSLQNLGAGRWDHLRSSWRAPKVRVEIGLALAAGGVLVAVTSAIRKEALDTRLNGGVSLGDFNRRLERGR